MKKSDNDFGLPTFEDLFSTQEMRDEKKLEKIREIPLSELHPFKDHPFKIKDDEDMRKLIESTEKFGNLVPALARPLPEGGYELISGHRRLAACEALGIEKLPVIVRDLTDDEAVIAMVDANLQRETILPSEKAFAYKMKLEAIRHQGKRSDLTSSQFGTKLRADELVAKENIDSRNQIHRYIRLTYLHPDLLMKVDDKEIAFNPAVEISYLKLNEQVDLINSMEKNDCTPSLSQALKLKKLSQEGTLDYETIDKILSEEKPNQREQLKLKVEEFKKYFPKSYTAEEMKKDIFKGLELLKRQRERNRDGR